MLRSTFCIPRYTPNAVFPCLRPLHGQRLSLPRPRKTGRASIRFYPWFNSFSLALNLIGSKSQDVYSGLTPYTLLHQSMLIQSPQVIPSGKNIHWRLQFSSRISFLFSFIPPRDFPPPWRGAIPLHRRWLETAVHFRLAHAQKRSPLSPNPGVHT